jgi:hypothetical protein
VSIEKQWVRSELGLTTGQSSVCLRNLGLECNAVKKTVGHSSALMPVPKGVLIWCEPSLWAIYFLQSIVSVGMTPEVGTHLIKNEQISV